MIETSTGQQSVLASNGVTSLKITVPELSYWLAIGQAISFNTLLGNFVATGSCLEGFTFLF